MTNPAWVEINSEGDRYLSSITRLEKTTGYVLKQHNCLIRHVEERAKV